MSDLPTLADFVEGRRSERKYLIGMVVAALIAAACWLLGSALGDYGGLLFPDIAHVEQWTASDSSRFSVLLITYLGLLVVLAVGALLFGALSAALALHYVLFLMVPLRNKSKK